MRLFYCQYLSGMDCSYEYTCCEVEEEDGCEGGDMHCVYFSWRWWRWWIVDISDYIHLYIFKARHDNDDEVHEQLTIFCH